MYSKAIVRLLNYEIARFFSEHFQEHYEERFIPDPFINSIRDELGAGQERVEKEKAEKEATSAAKAARKQALLLKSIQTDD